MCIYIYILVCVCLNAIAQAQASSTPGSCIKRITGKGCTVFTSPDELEWLDTMEPHGNFMEIHGILMECS